MTTALDRFAAQIGPSDPVCAVGGRTQWEIGGLPDPGTREVAAPAGVVEHIPAEMIVRARAGTRLDELDSALAERGQRVALEGAGDATLGGIIAVGRSGVRRLGLGPVRDAVLEVTAVSSRGELIRSGAPLVKNVTGFDLTRLLTGSLGTLALIAEVVLRCTPRPELERWYVGEAGDPFQVFAALFRPASVLWDGRQTWVCLAGFEVDVEEQARRVLGNGFVAVDAPPALPNKARRSLTPAELRELPARVGQAGSWVCEVGVGMVHCDEASSGQLEPALPPSTELIELHRRIKQNFDPSGRMNPGRQVLAGASVAV